MGRKSEHFSGCRVDVVSCRVVSTHVDARHECRFRLRRPYHPHPVTKLNVSLRHQRKCTGLDQSLTSQVGDNTYATMVGRMTYPWLNATYLKARCSDHSILSFLQQMSSVSLTSTVSQFMDMPTTCRSTTTVSSTTCTTSHPGLSTASVVSGSG